MVQGANYAGLLTSLPAVEQILDDHASELGNDLIAYRNHVYRVVNLCLAMLGDSRVEFMARGGPLRFDLHESSDLTTTGLTPTSRVSTRAHLLELERASIVKTLERSRGKIYGPGGAAAILGMRPTTLTSKIAALQIKRR